MAKIRLLGDFQHSTRIAFIEFMTAEGAMAALNCSGALLGEQEKKHPQGGFGGGPGGLAGLTLSPRHSIQPSKQHTGICLPTWRVTAKYLLVGNSALELGLRSAFK